MKLKREIDHLNKSLKMVTPVDTLTWMVKSHKASSLQLTFYYLFTRRLCSRSLSYYLMIQSSKHVSNLLNLHKHQLLKPCKCSKERQRLIQIKVFSSRYHALIIIPPSWLLDETMLNHVQDNVDTTRSRLVRMSIVLEILMILGPQALESLLSPQLPPTAI